MVGDDAFGNGEPQTGTAGLVGNEGLQNGITVLCRDAAAVILYVNADAALVKGGG